MSRHHFDPETYDSTIAGFVLGDLIVPDDPGDAVTPIDGIHDKPSSMADQLAWLRDAGFVATTVWLERDLCVLTGTTLPDHA